MFFFSIIKILWQVKCPNICTFYLREFSSVIYLFEEPELEALVYVVTPCAQFELVPFSSCLGFPTRARSQIP